MKNSSTDFGQCRCLYELDLAETATAQIDVVWTLENSGFIQHHHRKMQKTVRNVVRIIVFEEFLQRYFKNLHISLYGLQGNVKSYNITSYFFTIFRLQKGDVVISRRKKEIIQHYLYGPLTGEHV